MKNIRLQHQTGSRRSFLLQQQQKGPKMKAPQAIAPPVTQSAVEINQAKRDSTLQNAAKKGYAATVLAGETGGYAANPTEKKTVLGG